MVGNMFSTTDVHSASDVIDATNARGHIERGQLTLIHIVMACDGDVSLVLFLDPVICASINVF